MVELLLVDLVLRTLRDDAACTDVIQVVQILGRITLHLVGIDGVQSLNGLSLQTHIIIIGGIDDGIFRLGIEQTTGIPLRKGLYVLIDTVHGTACQLTELMELAVSGTTLAETHLLDIGDEEFHLVIRSLYHLGQQFFSLVVFHPCDMDECQIVEGLSPTRRIMSRQIKSLLGKVPGTVDISIVKGIR